MQLLDLVSLVQLRVFESVYRTKSMTKAAEELHLTQSGVSQHIKTLEETLDVALFDRIRQKLVPTTAGRYLYDACTIKLGELEETLQVVARRVGELEGEVVIGLPAEFGMNMIVPLLAQFMHKNPAVTTRIRIDLADAMNDMILRGEIDFAFVDDFKLDSRIATSKVYEENLEFCYSKKYRRAEEFKLRELDRKFFESLDYIAYKEDLPILQKWFAHHFKMRRLNLPLKAVVSDVLGVAKFVCEGIGVGILPRHNIHKLRAAGEDIQVLQPPGKALVNTISVAYLEGRSQSPVSKTCQDWLIAELKKFKTDMESQFKRE